MSAASLPIDGFDAVLVAQTYASRPMTTHHVLEHDRVLPPHAWLCAVRRLVDRFPALASRLRLRPTLQRVALQLSPAELAARIRWDDDGSHAALEAWMSLPFDLEREPPFRVRISPAGMAARSVVLSLHHGSTDGVGALVVFDTLLRLAAGLPAGERGAPSQPPPSHVRVDVREAGRRIASWLRPTAKLVDAVDGPDAIDAIVRGHPGHAVIVRELDHGHWDALGLRARGLGVSRNTLLCHAALHAVAASPRDDATRALRMLSCVDLRGALGIPGDRLQNWLGTVELELDPHAPLRADAARRLHAALAHARAPQRALVTPWLLGQLVRWLPTSTARAVFRFADSDRFPNTYTFMLSHLRTHADQCCPPPLRPRRLWCTSLLPRKPGLGLTVSTVGDRVTIAASWPAAALRRETIDALLDRMLHALQLPDRADARSIHRAVS